VDGNALPLAVLRRAHRATSRWLPVFIAVICGLHVSVTWFFEDESPRWLLNYLHLDREQNLPAWFAATQLSFLAGLFAAMSLVESATGTRATRTAAWLACAGGALFLSADEATALHEAVGDAIGQLTRDGEPGSLSGAIASFPSYYWPLVYVPLGIPLILLAARFFWQQLHERERWQAVIALAVYLTGALVLDHLAGLAANPSDGWIRIGFVTLDIILVEELFELTGVALLLMAMFDRLLRVSGVPLESPSGEPGSSELRATGDG
jgi:hypothetical protein